MKSTQSTFFTCVILLGDVKNLNRLLDSIYNGIKEEDVQCIIVDGNGVQSDEEIVLPEKYSQYIETVTADSLDLLEVYEAVKGKMTGKYVTVISSDMHYSSGTLLTVKSKLSLNKKKALCIKPVYIDPTGANLEYSAKPLATGNYNVIYNPEGFNFYFHSYFIDRKIFEKLGFSKSVVLEKDKDFLMRFILKYKKIQYLGNNTLFYYNSAENEFATNLIQHNKEWYQDDVEGFLTDWINKADDMPDAEALFIKECVLYLIFSRFNCNTNDRNKKVLDEEEIDRFYNSAAKVLSKIDDELIINKIIFGGITIPRSLKFYMLDLKYEYLGTNYQIIDNNSEFLFYSELNEPVKYNYVVKKGRERYLLMPNGDNEESPRTIVKPLTKAETPFVEYSSAPNKLKKLILIEGISKAKVAITAINYEKGKLEIDAKSMLIDYLAHEDINIIAVINDEELPLTPVSCYPILRSFGRVYRSKYQFHVTVPVNNKTMGKKLEFYLEWNGSKYLQTLVFQGPASRLNNNFIKSYWQFDKNKLLVHNGTNSLMLKNVKTYRIMGREVKLLHEMKKYMLQNGLYEEYGHLLKLRRKFVFHRKKYLKKNIWVSFDKLYKAGDNGEYMYHYLKENQHKVKPYYIVNEDAPDYERLKAAKENILITNSDESKLTCLGAKVILATHTKIWTYCGFTDGEQEYFKDLFDAKLVCIQHGLTVQKIAQYQNRLFDNTQYYCCASKYEVENILQPIYGYNKKQIALTGLARYDGLKNDDKKIILITPTWRRDVVNIGIACVKKTHNNHFKESTYFKIYDKLVNDKTLIEKAKKTGYQIVFLLHPAMSAQSVDYTRNDYVQIVEATSDISYERILTQSSLMVTDYSGVQFDFAYMRKPVVYYHPSALPPFYEEGVYQYDTMGFGEICKEHDELIKILCGYMDNGCKCKDEYKKRADDFFAFDDHNSCERIYKAVEEFEKNY